MFKETADIDYQKHLPISIFCCIPKKPIPFSVVKLQSICVIYMSVCANFTIVAELTIFDNS